MSKKEQEIGATRSYFPLIENGGRYYVLVSHQELDNLIANLMHVAELNSDREYREALKGELKIRSRNWLDNLYEESGFSHYTKAPDADVHIIQPKVRRER